MSAEIASLARLRDPIGVSPLSFWAATAQKRGRSIKILREERPVSWRPSPRRPDAGSGERRHLGSHPQRRHRLRREAPQLFCSGRGAMFETVPQGILDAAQCIPGDGPRAALDVTLID